MNLKQWESLIATSPTVIYIAKASGDFDATFISPNIRAQLGYAPHEFIRDSQFWANHIHPDDAPRVLAGMEALLELGQQTLEYRFLAKDGTYRWMHDELRVVRDADGKPIEIIGYWIDLTEQKCATQMIQQLSRVVEQTEDSVIITDCAGVIEYVNPAFERHTGYCQAEALGKTPRILKSGKQDDAFYKTLWETICAGQRA